MALEPEWEAKFEPASYGFRPGRSQHDALQHIFTTLKCVDRWVLRIDIKACFDEIDHDVLVTKLHTFSKMERVIRAWLRSSAESREGIFPQTTGVPQGSPIGPLLANIALDGLLEHVRRRIPQTFGLNGKRHQTRVIGIRFADDIVTMARRREDVEQALALTAEWLDRIGLRVNRQKSKIVHATEGFDFLGLTVKRLYSKGRKTINTTPSRESVRSHLRDLRRFIRGMRAASQSELINKLNPIIRGWTNYHRHYVSSRIFNWCDMATYKMLRRWALRKYPKKKPGWIHRKHWRGSVFTDGKVSLLKHADTKISRYVMVKTSRSPYDGDLTYWRTRTKHRSPIRTWLHHDQKGICPICRDVFLPWDVIELHHIDGNHANHRRHNLQLVHGHCHQTTFRCP
jgi:RNA-directed DNA polymerase